VFSVDQHIDSKKRGARIGTTDEIHDGDFPAGVQDITGLVNQRLISFSPMI